MKGLLFSTVLFMVLMFAGTAYAQRVNPKKGPVGCQKSLEICTDLLGSCGDDLGTCNTDLGTCQSDLGQANTDLGTCNTSLGTCTTDLGTCDTDLDTCEMDLMTCEDETQTFPGDGNSDPYFGTNGHGPALSYTDNGDGTFTDNNTKCMWEIKDNAGGVHDRDNTYTWTIGTTQSNGTLFTVFLDTLNNTCDGDESTPCITDEDCTGTGGNEVCGHAGYTDWVIPNIKILQSLVDYSTFNAAINASVPGDTVGNEHWSSNTTAANSNLSVFHVNFAGGTVGVSGKGQLKFARAVRGCN